MYYNKKTYRLINLLLAITILLSSVIVPNNLAKADETRIERIAGNNRYETAINILEESGLNPSKVIIASGENFADALVFGVLSMKADIPILLSSKDKLPEKVIDKLNTLDLEEIIIAGGPNSISKEQENQLKKYAPVLRIFGENRSETSIELKKYLEKLYGPRKIIAVADSSNYPDALVAVPRIYEDGVILLTNSEYKFDEANLVFGGENSVPGYEGVKRIAGQTRYETALEIVKELGSDKLIIADGENYPDALSASILAKTEKAPILIVPRDKNTIKESGIKNFIENRDLNKVYIIGGVNSVKEEVESYFKELLGNSKSEKPEKDKPSKKPDFVGDEETTKPSRPSRPSNPSKPIRPIEPIKIDKSGLKKVLDQAKGRKAGDYTKSSFDGLEDVIEKAESIFANEDVNQDQVDRAKEALEKALKALVKKVNKTGLESVLREAKRKDKAEYTPESFEKLQDAIAKAESVVANENARQNQVDEAKETLEKAIADLIEKADKTDLEESIKEAKEEKPEEYTESSYKKLQEAIDQAKEILEKENASEDEIAEAIKSLEEAREALVKKADKTELENALTVAKGKEEENYTPESFENLKEEIDKAEEILEKENASEEEVSKAVKDLEQAVEALVAKADKTELKDAIEKAAPKLEGNYTEESLNKLKDALEKAEALVENENASQEEVDEAKETLEKAIQDLVEKADKTDLKNAITEAKEKEEGKYTPESFKELQDAITEADKVLSNAEASQKEVDEAKETLEKATQALVEKADKTELKALITKATPELEGKYTEESLNNLKDAIEKAEALVDDENASQEEVDKAKEDLENALKALATKVDKTELENAITEAKSKEEENYTPESLKKLQDAITEADKVLSNAEASQKEVDEAKETLQKATQALVEKADKTTLKNLIDESESIKESVLYTNSDQAKKDSYDDAIDKAKTVLDDENASVEEVAAAVKAIEDAKKELDGEEKETYSLEVIVNNPQRISDFKLVAVNLDDGKEVELTQSSQTLYKADLEEGYYRIVAKDIKSSEAYGIFGGDEILLDGNKKVNVDLLKGVQLNVKSEDVEGNAVHDVKYEIKVNGFDFSIGDYRPKSYDGLFVPDIDDLMPNKVELLVKTAPEGYTIKSDRQVIVSKKSIITNKDLQGFEHKFIFIKDGQVDKLDLKEMIEKADSLNKEDYTDLSYENLEEVLANAKSVMDDKNASQDQVDEQTENLKNAIENIVKLGDKTKLKTLLENSKDKKREDYSEKSFNDLLEAIEKAEAVMKNDQASHEDVDEVYKTLLEANNNLEQTNFAAKKEKLESLIVEANKKEENGSYYDQEKLKELVDLRDDAQNYLDDPDKDTSEIDDYIEKLDKALDELTPLEEEGIFEFSDRPDGVIINGLTAKGKKLVGETKELLIPEYYNGKKVIELKDKMIFSNIGIKSLYIEADLIKTPTKTFFGNPLQRIVLNEGLEELGDLLFGQFQIKDEEDKLRVIKLPSSLKKIGNSTFNSTRISEIEIPAGVTNENLAWNAFSEVPGNPETNKVHVFTEGYKNPGKLEDKGEMIIDPAKIVVNYLDLDGNVMKTESSYESEDGYYRLDQVNKVKVTSPDPKLATSKEYVEVLAKDKVTTIDVQLIDKERESYLVEIKKPEDMEVEYGTSKFDILDELPSKITIVDNKGNEQELDANWEGFNYDAERPGTYSFTAKLNLPEGMKNPSNLDLNINVHVEVLARSYTLTLKLEDIEGSGLEGLKLIGDNSVVYKLTEEDEGTYTASLPSGSYRVEAEGLNDGFELIGGNDIKVEAEDKTVELQIVQKEYELNINLTNEDAASFDQLVLTDSNGKTYELEEKDGNYIAKLVNGEYTVEAKGLGDDYQLKGDTNFEVKGQDKSLNLSIEAKGEEKYTLTVLYMTDDTKVDGIKVTDENGVSFNLKYKGENDFNYQTFEAELDKGDYKIEALGLPKDYALIGKKNLTLDRDETVNLALVKPYKLNIKAIDQNGEALDKVNFKVSYGYTDLSWSVVPVENSGIIPDLDSEFMTSQLEIEIDILDLPEGYELKDDLPKTIQLNTENYKDEIIIEFEKTNEDEILDVRPSDKIVELRPKSDIEKGNYIIRDQKGTIVYLNSFSKAEEKDLKANLEGNKKGDYTVEARLDEIRLSREFRY